MILVEILESFVRSSIVVGIDGLLNVCKELAKFVIILLILYYFAAWAFDFWDEVLGRNVYSITHAEISGIGRFEQTSIKHTPSLVDQLEIEVEYEENKEKLMKSNENFRDFIQEEKKEEKGYLYVKDSDEGVIIKRELVSLTEQDSNETSRASQTLRTSLGKKSKLKESENVNIDNNENSTQQNENQMERLSNVNIKREPQSFDDQYDNESFHRT